MLLQLRVFRRPLRVVSFGFVAAVLLFEQPGEAVADRFRRHLLLGVALLRVLRSERRRADLEPLLSTIARTAPGTDVQGFSLRRVGRQRSAVPDLLSSRLDLAFAATGNRIRPAHLVATGIGAAAAVGLLAKMGGW